MEIIAARPLGVILSGGPSSVYQDDAPRLPWELSSFNECPVLGICYGLQLIASTFGGKVLPSANREYGFARLKIIDSDSRLFASLPDELDVWLSHGDVVTQLPAGFKGTAIANQLLNAIEDLSRRIYGVQFHPEVAHTPLGKLILHNFIFDICSAVPGWTTDSIVSEQVNHIKDLVGTGKVICGLSGGVDSTVTAAIINEAIGAQQTCVFVDNGLLREGEFDSVRVMFEQNMCLNVRAIEQSSLFLDRLKDVAEPEKKRHIIGHTFIEVFEQEAQHLGGVDFLGQGTLYPDVIESVSLRGNSSVIKSHHNVGGLPPSMRLRLIEPLRELFKDEVRQIGRHLGVPAEILDRHPFPGPGLAVRTIGPITLNSLNILRAADHIVEAELRGANVYSSLWQAFPVLLPVWTVGVMGDSRTYEQVIAVRAVTSVDGMTADWARLPYDVLAKISSRIVSEIIGVNRVVFDITSKPPSTIEWE